MFKKMPFKKIIYAVLLCIIVTSCNNNKTVYSTLNKTNNVTKVQSKINFKSVTALNETNKKVIEIATIAFNKSNELEKSQLILKIKRDHLRIESELKRISVNNYIIIPEPIFDLKTSETFLKEINYNEYLISLLDKEIKNQIILLDGIENKTTDIEFKTFVYKYKDTLISNNAKLEEYL